MTAPPLTLSLSKGAILLRLDSELSIAAALPAIGAASEPVKEAA